MPDETLEIVTAEVAALHEFFVDWFRGTAPVDSFEPRFLAPLSPDFTMIPPSGQLLERPTLVAAIRDARGGNPDIRIAVRNVAVRRVLNDHVLATYEEWQRNALPPARPDNGRISTVLFRRSPRLEWLHVQETWLPEAVMAAGPYDF